MIDERVVYRCYKRGDMIVEIESGQGVTVEYYGSEKHEAHMHEIIKKDIKRALEQRKLAEKHHEEKMRELD